MTRRKENQTTMSLAKDSQERLATELPDWLERVCFQSAVQKHYVTKGEHFYVFADGSVLRRKTAVKWVGV